MPTAAEELADGVLLAWLRSLREVATEEATLRPPMGVVVIWNVAHDVVDVDRTEMRISDIP